MPILLSPLSAITIRIGRPGRAALALAIACALPSGGSAAGSSGAGDPAGGDGPSYLAGIDLELPAQEAFGGWPPPALAERSYWLPWGRVALDRAALFSRPVLLVLDVNWAHSSAVMLDQTLSDPRVLREINAGFVAVRVNADLRPDLRERYQSGSWPTIAFLLPDGRPMLSTANDRGVDLPITIGTVDPETMLFLVREGRKYWDLEAAALLRRAESWAATEGPPRPLHGFVDAGASDRLAQWLVANSDRRDGGFGAAPKHVLPGLAEYARLRAARGVDDLVAQSALTLLRLVEGPLFDHRGGGIHRVAIAPGFGEIQYEKLLSSNAALARELAIALADGAGPEPRRELAATVRFVRDVLGRAEGGFYLAQLGDPALAAGAAAGAVGAAAPPPLDPLVLAGANALAGSALLRAAAALADDEIERAGVAALDFVLREAVTADGAVRHVIAPPLANRIYLETQADVALAFVEAYEATGNRAYLTAAAAAAEYARRSLADPGSAALRDHVGEPAPLGLLANPRWPLRPNVRLARALLRLSWHGLGAEHAATARAILAQFSGDLSGFRVHAIEAALAIEEAIAEPIEIRISGPPEDSATRSLRRAAWTASAAGTVVVLTGGSDGLPLAEIGWRGRTARVGEAAALAPALRRLAAEAGR